MDSLDRSNTALLKFRIKRQSSLLRGHLTKLRDRQIYPLPTFSGGATLPLSSIDDQIGEPFFILGSPRSGTTLLREIVNRHPHLYIPPENGSILRMIQAFVANRREPWLVAVERVLDEFEQGYEAQYWNLNKAALLLNAEEVKPSQQSLATLYELIYREYGARMQPEKRRWGDKSTPGKFSYLDKMNLVFPQSKFINIVRDGRDCVASAVKAGFFEKSFIRAAYAWSDNETFCRRFGASLGEHRYHSLRYEDLLDDPDKSLKQICAFLNEDFYPSMLDSAESLKLASPDVKSIAHHKNVLRPLNKDSIGKWKHQIPLNMQTRVCAILHKQLAYYSYSS